MPPHVPRQIHCEKKDARKRLYALAPLVFFWVLIITTNLSWAGSAIIEKKDVFVSTERSHYRIPSICISNAGVVLCFANRRVDTVADGAKEVHLVTRRSTDGGWNWEPIKDLFAKKGWDAAMGTATMDSSTGTAMVSYSRNPRVDYADARATNSSVESGDFMAISRDGGKTWTHEKMIIHPDDGGYRGHSHGSSPGVALYSGPYHGRLLASARFQHKPGEELHTLQNHHYNCTLYSDDHGKTWQTGGPVQVGTGEGCLAELSDGTIYYNSRAYFLDGKRRIAWSYDGGETFEDFAVDNTLIEPTGGGCNAGMAGFPKELSADNDLILFSNPASDERKKLTVHLSRDGGRTWPVSKVIYEGPAAYSSMAVSENGTIFVLYENGEKHPYEKISIAWFNLKWLIN
jgi:sialidase-1